MQRHLVDKVEGLAQRREADAPLAHRDFSLQGRDLLLPSWPSVGQHDRDNTRAIAARSSLLLPAEREHLEVDPVRQLEHLAIAARIDLPELAHRRLILVAAAAARLGRALVRLLGLRLITLRLLAHGIILRAFVSATAQPQAQGSSRRSRSADLRVSSTPFRAAAVASGGAASAHDSQALAAEIQAAPLRLWFASWHCVSSAPEIQSSCTTCTSGGSTRLAGETSPRVAERPLSTA